MEALEVHDPVPLEIKESFHFGTHHQQSNELNSDFVVALKQLSTHCIIVISALKRTTPGKYGRTAQLIYPSKYHA